MFKQTPLFLLLVATLVGGCSQTTPAVTQAQRKATAQTLVNSITGNARGSRNKARGLLAEADALVAAKDYKGAMGKRLEILGVRPKNFSTLGSLTFYTTQQLALRDLAPVASHLDAPSSLKYADQLAAIDAGIPTYASMLQAQKADNIKDFTTYSRDPKEWRRAIDGLDFTAQERQTLYNTSAEQIKTNIAAVYDAEAKRATGPYSGTKAPVPASIDPYTTTFAMPSNLGRFFWTKAKTERILTIAALLDRSERIGKQRLTRAPLKDPFGMSALTRKNGVIYSVGPDTKDDGGKSVPNPNLVRITDVGDMLAPTF
jgi:hypothetical protein